MQQRLSFGLQAGRGKMGVGVPDQQLGLKKQHAGRPDIRATAKPRQNIFPDQWLDLKEEERSRESRQDKRKHGVFDEVGGTELAGT